MLSIVITIELLKNSIMGINKITSIVHFNATETDGEFIFQQLYCTLVTRTISQLKIKFKYIKKLAYITTFYEYAYCIRRNTGANPVLARNRNV
ncbi:hypothetical protein LIBRA_06500 [Leptospira interrogans]